MTAPCIFCHACFTAKMMLLHNSRKIRRMGSELSFSIFVLSVQKMVYAHTKSATKTHVITRLAIDFSQRSDIG